MNSVIENLVAEIDEQLEQLKEARGRLLARRANTVAAPRVPAAERTVAAPRSNKLKGRILPGSLVDKALGLLNDGKVRTTDQVATELKCDRGVIGATLYKLADRGLVVKVGVATFQRVK